MSLPRTRRTTGLRACWFTLMAAAAGLLAALPVQAQFTPNESVVSANRGLIDYEFSQQRAKLAWTDSKGVMWLANVDRDTGDFIPWTGRGESLDVNTVSGWNMFMWNGPEWVTTRGGEQIFYSYYVPNAPRLAQNTRMAIMAMDSTGRWNKQDVDTGGQARMSHIGSKNKGDANPTLKYLDPQERQYWRNALDPNSEQLLDWLPPSTKSWRFANGMRALMYTKEVNGVAQVFRYMLDTQQHEQITFDSGAKDLNRTVPWQWQAPEFNDDVVLSTVVDGSELRIYRQFNGTGTFTPVYSATLPEGRQAGSPEWFTYNGKSYVFMVAYVGGAEYPTEIWISSIDPAAPLLRRINDNTLHRARNDPEVFITNNRGPLIYYNRYDPSIDPAHPLCADCSEGVFRADPGLLGR